jgi:hypothetical protein
MISIGVSSVSFVDVNLLQIQSGGKKAKAPGSVAPHHRAH